MEVLKENKNCTISWVSWAVLKRQFPEGLGQVFLTMSAHFSLCIFCVVTFNHSWFGFDLICFLSCNSV